jgi:hypothetical protein
MPFQFFQKPKVMERTMKTTIYQLLEAGKIIFRYWCKDESRYYYISKRDADRLIATKEFKLVVVK